MSENKGDKTIELNGLPKRKIGLREVIDWKNIKSEKVFFKYFNVSGELELNYLYTKKGTSNNNMHYCSVKYKDREIIIADSNLRKVKLGTLLNGLIINKVTNKPTHKFDGWNTRKRAEYKYSIGEIIEKQETSFKVISQFKNHRNNKAYVIMCTECNNKFEDEESEVTLKKVCPYCNNTKIKEGFNDVMTTHSWIAEYVVNKEELTKYSYGSLKSVVTQCPNCLKATNKKIIDLVTYGLRCSCNKTSIGEQTFEACLIVNKINYEREYIIDDSKRRFDFFLPESNTIVEIHGSQHYKQVHNWGNIEEIKRNDAGKKNLVLSKGFKYVCLDWSSGNPKKLIDQAFKEIPEIKTIDVSGKIEIIPRINQIVKLWEERPYDMSYIETKMKIKATTRKKLLRQARELELINYDSKYAMTKGNIRWIVNLNERKAFEGTAKLKEYFCVDLKSVYGNCRNNRGENTTFKSAGKHPITKEKLQWMYLEDYLNKYGESGLMYVNYFGEKYEADSEVVKHG